MASSKTLKGWAMVVLVVAAVIIDQVIKIEVKTNMCLHDHIKVFNWFFISFVENEGMAYGMTFINKFFLTSIRIVFVVVVTWYIVKQVAKGARWRFLVCLTLVLAGAIGNIIDCLFYGMVFTESTPYDIAQIVPWGEGYADMFYGKVVDMFYFPFIDTFLPQWVPFWGGDHFVFFAPVFNFADSCISVGVVALLLFCSKEIGAFSASNKEKVEEPVKDKQE